MLMYLRTSKNDFEKQLAKQEARERFMRRLYANIIKEKPEIAGADIERSVHQTDDDPQPKKTKRRSKRAPSTDEPLPYTNPEDHHHIAQSQRDIIELDTWLDVYGGGDPALKVRPLTFLGSFHCFILSSCYSPHFL